MPIVLDGTNGITTPDIDSTGPITGTTGTFTGDLKANGLTTELRPLVMMTAQASTSGTSVDFPSIPSWVKRATVLFDQTSLSGTDNYLVQLGTAGGLVSSGYLSASSGAGGVSSTAGMIIGVGGAGSGARLLSGAMVLTRITGNTWLQSHNSILDNVAMQNGTGRVELGAVLDRIRITTTGTNTFDAGSINVMYE